MQSLHYVLHWSVSLFSIFQCSPLFASEVSKSPGDYLTCANEMAGHYITRGLPADSDRVKFCLLPFVVFCFETFQNSDQVPEKKPQLEAMAYDSSAASGQNEINYAHLFEEELLKVKSKEQVAMPHFHFQGTSKKKVLDQPNGMIVQAELNITMPGRLCDWFVCFLVCFRSVHSFDLSCRTTHHLVGVSPSKDDDYICTGVSVGDQAGDQTIYAVSFSALGQDGPGIKAHHMILSKCKKPKKTGFGETWDCQHHAMCNDQARRSTAKSFFLMIPSSRARSCSRGPSTRSRPNYQTMLVSPSSRTNTWSCRCSHQVPIPVDHRLPPTPGALCETSTKRQQRTCCAGSADKAKVHCR